MNRVLKVSEQKPFFQTSNINPDLIHQFYKDLENLEGKGYTDQFDNIIGKLEVLALHGDDKAKMILNDFGNFFDFSVDGAYSQQLKDAIANVEWMTK